MKAKILIILTIFLVSLFINITRIVAVYDPLTLPNNKYGIHIIDENDLDNAAFLVNSTNGDWGYVVMVITQNDRNIEKWQNIFNRLGSSHLIPIVRLATRSNKDVWEKPKEEEAVSWAEFLDSLEWVSENRYVVMFNEPNHAKEWGDTISPEEYAQILIAYSKAFKAKSDKFFILPSGFDSSAPNSSLTMDQKKYVSQMLASYPDFFSYIDGWTSHSYPNPGFRGKVTDRGRGTIGNYLWEMDLLKDLGVKKDLPVFITETGWPHEEGNVPNRSYYNAKEVAQLITMASQNIWQDSRIAAVIPFVLNYQSIPFLHFSWQKPNSNEFYPQFFAFQNIEKIKGEPLLDTASDKIKGVETGPMTPADNKKDYTSPSIAASLNKPPAIISNILKPTLSLI